MEDAKNYVTTEAKNEKIEIDENVNVGSQDTRLGLVIYGITGEFDETNIDSNYPYIIEEIPYENNEVSA